MAAFVDYLVYIGAGYTALTLAFYMLSFVIPQAAFVARVLASYVSLLVSASFGVFVSIALRLAGHVTIAQWATARCFKYAMLLTTGITFDIDDPHNHLGTVRPAVFISNHQTELDVLMLGAAFPKHCSMTAKSSLKKTPFLGWFMTLSGAIFINRANSKDARQAMTGAADQMRNMRQSVFIFPEGTRIYSKEPELLPFKKGAFHLAVQAQVPIVPVVVANYSHILWIRGLVFKSGSIPIKVLDPIPTTGLTPADVDELTQRTRDLFLKELIALTEKARGKPVPMAVKASSSSSNGATKATGVDL
ncbi:hypothetical protein QBC47DRAFT_393294 [Echria macrotheca]|uniref:1-acyl-sn-glycerol-3-phosphate acyltransferase n=1 Tax=Echria macrotheca TaxID=438768 RepID=A0AAJ0F113_9PEZI|nr:hypothetical protein QBC47DRAFT_393294 [Echria macrotheca]